MQGVSGGKVRDGMLRKISFLCAMCSKCLLTPVRCCKDRIWLLMRIYLFFLTAEHKQSFGFF